MEITSYTRPEWLKRERTIKKFNKFEELIIELEKEYYTDFHSQRGFFTGYIIPNGYELSYGPHPDGTIRISNHWSWYANKKNCKDEKFVQCYLDGVEPEPRFSEGMASRPIKRTEIAICKNGKYYKL